MSPALKLAKALESLSSEDRQEVVAWLVNPGPGDLLPYFGPRTRPGAEDRPRASKVSRTLSWTGMPPDWRRQVTGLLPSGENSQLVTVRLPTEQHSRLRDWCGEHNFTMAAVVRGLIERFLDEQSPEQPAS